MTSQQQKNERTNDIVKRLRDYATGFVPLSLKCSKLMREAADKIEQAEARIVALKNAISTNEDAIQQTLGKALGYPNYPPRSDSVCVGEHVAETLAIEAARKIEQLHLWQNNHE